MNNSRIMKNPEIMSKSEIPITRNSGINSRISNRKYVMKNIRMAIIVLMMVIVIIFSSVIAFAETDRTDNSKTSNNSYITEKTRTDTQTIDPHTSLVITNIELYNKSLQATNTLNTLKPTNNITEDNITGDHDTINNTGRRYDNNISYRYNNNGDIKNNSNEYRANTDKNASEYNMTSDDSQVVDDWDFSDGFGDAKNNSNQGQIMIQDKVTRKLDEVDGVNKGSTNNFGGFNRGTGNTTSDRSDKSNMTNQDIPDNLTDTPIETNTSIDNITIAYNSTEESNHASISKSDISNYTKSNSTIATKKKSFFNLIIGWLTLHNNS